MAIIIDDPTAVIAAAVGAPVLTDYDNDLIGPSFDLWLPEPSKITMDGSNLIAAVNTQKTTGGQSLLQSVAASKPIYVAGQINGRGIMRFTGVASGAPDKFAIPNFPAGASLSWTKFAVLKAPAVNGAGISNQHIWSSEGTNAHRMELAYSVGSGEHLLARGGAALASTCNTPRPLNTFFLAIESFDAAAGRFAISVDGAAFTVAAVGAVTVDVAVTGIGALASNGSGTGLCADVALIGCYPAALHLSANAATLADLKQFVRDYFALSVA